MTTRERADGIDSPQRIALGDNVCDPVHCTGPAGVGESELRSKHTATAIVLHAPAYHSESKKQPHHECSVFSDIVDVHIADEKPCTVGRELIHSAVLSNAKATFDIRQQRMVWDASRFCIQHLHQSRIRSPLHTTPFISLIRNRTPLPSTKSSFRRSTAQRGMKNAPYASLFKLLKKALSSIGGLSRQDLCGATNSNTGHYACAWGVAFSPSPPQCTCPHGP